MRHFCNLIVILCLLFASMESAMGITLDGLLHGDEVAHQEEFGHSLDAHDGTSSDSDLDGDHCDHCCHAQSASIGSAFAAATPPTIGNDYALGRSRPQRNIGQAPPTPPPNA